MKSYSDDIATSDTIYETDKKAKTRFIILMLIGIANFCLSLFIMMSK